VTDSLQREIQTLRELHGSERDPHGRAFAPLADALRRAGHVKESLAILLTGLKAHPDFASGHVVAARTYLDAGMVAEAELSAHRVLELDGENVEGLRLLSLAQEAQGAEPEARRTRRRLRELEGPAETEAREGWSEPVDESENEAASMDELSPDPPAPEDAPGDGSEDTGEAEGPSDPAEGDAFVELSALAPDADSDEEPAEADAPDAEPIVDLDALAPDDAEPVGLDALAPDDPEPVGLDALAPDDPEAVDLDALAPDDPEPVDLGALAPDEPEAEEDAEELVASAAPAPDSVAGEEAEDGRDEEQAPAKDPDLDPHAPLPTRTLADLYARQGMTDRARSVYLQLLRVTPEDQGLRDRIAALEGETDEPADAAAPSKGDRTEAPEDPTSLPPLEDADQDEAVASAIGWGPKDGAHGPTVDTPFAWTQDDPDAAAAAGPPIGDYFDRLLAWGRDDDEARDAGGGS